MTERPFSWKETLHAFGYALQGIRKFMMNERNARLHLLATILVVLSSLFFRVTRWEAVALTVVVGFVWVAEIFNTCIEKTMDFISMEKRKEIKYIKDLAAGAVLIASLAAFIIGLLIFIPKIR